MPVFHSCAKRVSWKLARKKADSLSGVAIWSTSQATRPSSKPDLAFAKHDATFGQVVGGEFHADAVAGDDADEVLAHPARDMCHHEVAAFNLHAKPRVGEGLRHDALDFECFFFLLFHRGNQPHFPVVSVGGGRKSRLALRLETDTWETATILQS